MTKQFQIHEAIKRNVFKSTDELGNMVWKSFDARHGDFFYCDTYQDAVNTFVGNWDNLTPQEKNNC